MRFGAKACSGGNSHQLSAISYQQAESPNLVGESQGTEGWLLKATLMAGGLQPES